MAPSDDNRGGSPPLVRFILCRKPSGSNMACNAASARRHDHVGVDMVNRLGPALDETERSATILRAISAVARVPKHNIVKAIAAAPRRWARTRRRRPLNNDKSSLWSLREDTMNAIAVTPIGAPFRRKEDHRHHHRQGALINRDDLSRPGQAYAYFPALNLMPMPVSAASIQRPRQQCPGW